MTAVVSRELCAATPSDATQAISNFEITLIIKIPKQSFPNIAHHTLCFEILKRELPFTLISKLDTSHPGILFEANGSDICEGSALFKCFNLVIHVRLSPFKSWSL